MDITPVIKARVPTTNDSSISQTLSNLAAAGKITKVARGVFRYDAPLPGPPPTQSPPPPSTHVMPEPAAVPAADTVDDDIMELDYALAALGRIEAVVRRNRDIIKQFRELKGMLDKLGVK